MYLFYEMLVKRAKDHLMVRNYRCSWIPAALELKCRAGYSMLKSHTV